MSGRFFGVLKVDPVACQNRTLLLAARRDDGLERFQLLGVQLECGLHLLKVRLELLLIGCLGMGQRRQAERGNHGHAGGCSLDQGFRKFWKSSYNVSSVILHFG